MSSIERFYTTTFTVQRHVWSGDSSALVAQDDFLGHLQQQTDQEYTEYLGLRFGKAWTIWCATTVNIKEDDRITAGGKDFIVKFVTDRNLGNNAHQEVIVELV